MNEVLIESTKVAIKNYNGQRVVTFKDIDRVHNRVEGTARKRFNDNRKHFIEGEDYFKITPSEFRTTIGIMDKRQQNDITLITESGYLLLVKSFTDDLSWIVQRELVKSYFREKHRESLNSETTDVVDLPYHYVDKTFNGIPIITIADLCNFYNLSYSYLYSVVLRDLRYDVDFTLLQRQRLKQYRKENPNASMVKSSLYIIYKSGFDKLLDRFDFHVGIIPKALCRNNANVDRRRFIVQEEVVKVMDYIRRDLKGIEALTYLVESADTADNLENYRKVLVDKLSALGRWKIDTSLVKLGIHQVTAEELTAIQKRRIST